MFPLQTLSLSISQGFQARKREY